MTDTDTTSPEAPISRQHELVQELSSTVTEALNSYQIQPTSTEDGTLTRKLGRDLVETTDSNGARSYQYTSFFYTDRDRGALIWKWHEGSKTIEFTEDAELEGKKTKTIGDEDGVSRVIRDVKSEIVRIPQPEQQTEQKGRWRILGRRALKR